MLKIDKHGRFRKKIICYLYFNKILSCTLYIIKFKLIKEK